MNTNNNFNLNSKTYIELKQLQTLVDDIEHFSTNMNRDFAVIYEKEQSNPLLILLQAFNLVTISKYNSNNSFSRNFDLIAIYKTDNFNRFVTELNKELDIKSQDRIGKVITTDVNIEEVLEKLLIFMKNEVESLGLHLWQICFDFSPQFINTFIGNGLSVYCEEGEDLLKLKSKTNYSYDVIKQAINIAKIRKLVKNTNIHSRPNERCNSEYNIFVELTELGYSVAVENMHNAKIELNHISKIEDTESESILWLDYNNEQKILLNDIFLIHTCQMNSMNDRLMRFLIKPENNNKTFNRQELFDLGILKNTINKNDDLRSQSKETKSLFSFLDDIEIKGELRKIFFPNVATNIICLRNQITQDILDTLQIRYIDLKTILQPIQQENHKKQQDA